MFCVSLQTSEAVEELTPYEKLVGTIKSHNKSIAKKVLAKSHKILEKTEEVGGGSGEEKTWKPDAENVSILAANFHLLPE